MKTLVILQYLGPACGVLGFIISPGLTVIYPWLREKFDKERKEKSDRLLRGTLEERSIKTLVDLEIYIKELDEHFKFDWRPRVLRAKRRTKKIYKQLSKKGADNQ